MKKYEIMDHLDDLQRKVNKMGFTGQNEYDLHLREEISDWILSQFSAIPLFFFVVEEVEEGVWEQITVPLKTYEEAKAYKDSCDGKHPNAFIVTSLDHK